jgi:hypothetical protein
MKVIHSDVDIDSLMDTREDRQRLDAFNASREAIPLDEVKAWVNSWGSPNELQRPSPRKVG